MATDAEAILSHPRPDARGRVGAVAGGLREHWPVAAVCLGAFLIASTVLGGLRLFDNDYDWINSALDSGWLAIFADILRPIPEAWGFQHRPVQVLCFKVLHGVFGYDAAGYYAFKALLFAGVTFGIARFSASLGWSRRTAVLAAACFGLSAPGVASALWVSDFELLAQIAILAALCLFWRTLHLDTPSRRDEWLHQVLFVLLAVVAHRTKGSAKLIPAIVLLYLFLYRRDQVRRFLPAVAVIALTIVPVFTLWSDPVPPFAPFAEDQSQGWMWKPANFATLSTLLVGNFHPFWGTSGADIAYSLLSVLTPGLLWPVAAALVYLVLRQCQTLADPRIGFVAVWFAVTVAAYASFPRLPEGFMARYVVVALVPASILVAAFLTAAARRIERRIALAVFATCLTLHAAHNAGSTRHLRDTLGQVIVAYDLAREHVANTVQDADVLVIGFDYGYNRRHDDGNTYHRDGLDIHTTTQDRPLYVLVRVDQDLDAIDLRTPIDDIRRAVRFRVTRSGMRVRIRPVRTFGGLTDSLYDRHIYGSRQSFAAILYEVAFGHEDA